MDEAELEALLARLGITREQLDAIAEAGTYDEANAYLSEQAQRAEAMRNTPMPEGRQVGRVFVASHPLEALAAGLSRARGAKDYATAMGERRSLIDMLRKGNRTSGLMAAGAMLPPGRKPPPSAPPSWDGGTPLTHTPPTSPAAPGESILARILRALEAQGAQ